MSIISNLYYIWQIKIYIKKYGFIKTENLHKNNEQKNLTENTFNATQLQET